MYEHAVYMAIARAFENMRRSTGRSLLPGKNGQSNETPNRCMHPTRLVMIFE